MFSPSTIITRIGYNDYGSMKSFGYKVLVTIYIFISIFGNKYRGRFQNNSIDCVNSKHAMTIGDGPPLLSCL